MKTVHTRIGVIHFSVLAMLICCSARADGQQDAHLDANAVSAMKDQFVGHVSLDGHLITDVEPILSCKTKFLTKTGSTTIDWTTVQDPAGEIEPTEYQLPIVSAEGSHRFSAPKDIGDNDLNERMNATVGFLYLDCKPQTNG